METINDAIKKMQMLVFIREGRGRVIRRIKKICSELIEVKGTEEIRGGSDVGNIIMICELETMNGKNIAKPCEGSIKHGEGGRTTRDNSTG